MNISGEQRPTYILQDDSSAILKMISVVGRLPVGVIVNELDQAQVRRDMMADFRSLLYETLNDPSSGFTATSRQNKDVTFENSSPQIEHAGEETYFATSSAQDGDKTPTTTGDGRSARRSRLAQHKNTERPRHGISEVRNDVVARKRVFRNLRDSLENPFAKYAYGGGTLGLTKVFG
jgi:hypothetical protein